MIIQAEESDQDNDAIVLPKVVVKACLPLLEEIIVSMFDPLSASSSQSIYGMFTGLLDYDPSQEELSSILQALGTYVCD